MCVQDLLSSLNAGISTNESTEFTTDHVIYNLAYTQIPTENHPRGLRIILYELTRSTIFKFNFQRFKIDTRALHAPQGQRAKKTLLVWIR